MSELDNLAADEVAIPSFKGNNIAAGYTIINVITFEIVGYINEQGVRTNKQ